MLNDREVQGWDRQAPFWANKKSHFLSNADGPYAVRHEDVITALQPYREEILRSGGLILDIGSGALPEMYLPLGIKNRVVALDMSSAMLAFNTSRFKVIADANVSFPLLKESVEFTTMFFVNRYLKDQNLILDEAIRVLKKGGRFIMLDFNTNNHSLEKSLFEPEKLAEKVNTLGCSDVNVRIITDGKSAQGRFNSGSIYRVSLFTGRKAKF